MTLKEKVAEVEPWCVNENLNAGVLDCPSDYEYLNTGDSDYKCPSDVDYCCTACWNREYKEVPDERK